MQTPLQVLSARPKEAVLFMEGAKHLRKRQVWCECVCALKKDVWKTPLALSLAKAHTDTHGHARIRKHTMANVKMYSLCMTNPNIGVCCAECATLLPFLPKWIKGWLSAEGPGPFTWDWCLSIWCIKIIYSNPPRPSASCALLKPSASAERPQHTHTRDSQKLIDLWNHNQNIVSLSLSHSLTHTHTHTLFLSLLCLSYIFPGTVTLPCKLLTQQTLLRCGRFTTPASAERSALSQPISFQWGPAPLWSGHYHKLIHKLVRQGMTGWGPWGAWRVNAR